MSVEKNVFQSDEISELVFKKIELGIQKSYTDYSRFSYYFFI